MIWVLSSLGTVAMLRILNIVVLARLLEPDAFGLMSIALVVVGFSYVISDAGVGYTLVQQRTIDRPTVDTAVSLAACSGLIFFTIVWLTAPPVAEFFDQPELVQLLRALAVVFPLRSIAIPGAAILQRDLDFWALSRIDVIAYSSGNFVISVALAWYGFGVWSLVYGYIGEALVKALLIALVSGIPLRFRIHASRIKTFFRFGAGVSITNVANFIANQIDKVVVGRLLGTAQLGTYERAYQLMVLPSNALGQLVGRVLFPAMAKLQDNEIRLRENYRRSLSLTALAVLPMSVAIVLLADELVAVLLGPGWEESKGALRVLGTILMCKASYRMSDEIARACGAVYQHAWRQIVYAVAVGLFAFAGSSRGITGVATGVAIAIALNYLLMTDLGRRLTGITWSALFLAHLPAAILSITTAVACLLTLTAAEYWTENPIVIVGTSMIVSLAAVVVVIRAYPRCLGPDARWLLQTSKDHLPPRVGQFLRVLDDRQYRR